MATWIPVAGVAALVCVVLGVMAAVLASPEPVGSRRISVRLLLAVGAFIVLLVVGMVLVTAAPQLLGLPLVLAPGVGVAVALLLFGAVPWRSTRSEAIRTAALVPRAVWSSSTARDYGPPIAVALSLIVLLVATSATASLDDSGRSRALTVVSTDSTNTASPYPGWFYAGPLLAVTLAIVLAAVLAIQRTAHLPAVSLDAAADAAWRRRAAVVLSHIATAGLLLYLAATLLMVGGALHSVSLNARGEWAAGAAVAFFAGVVAAATAVVTLLSAARRAAGTSARVAE